MHVSLNRGSASSSPDTTLAATSVAAVAADRTKIRDLLTSGSDLLARGANADAAARLQELVQLKPRDAEAHNLLGVALCKLGRFEEAEQHFRKAIGIKPKLAEAHANLGNALRVTGQAEPAENALRRALNLKPGDPSARHGLGALLLSRARLREARAQFEKLLKTVPRSSAGLTGMGEIAEMEGRFDEAETLFRRVIEIDPEDPGPWGKLVRLRKMTSADGAWIERAQQFVARGLDPVEEANLRYAMGKYHDDVREFDAAFESFRRANELTKSIARKYRGDAHASFVDDLMRVYTSDAISRVQTGASDSMLPVLIVGMPRSGTTLAEQIIASHPAAAGAGELPFWTAAVREHEAAMRQGLLDIAVRKKLADDYLRVLRGFSAGAQRIVDKTPANLEYLGIIHSIFPKVRIIYMRRDPIDTCLSCYFQHFSAALSFTLDLSDLAHYCRQFHRMMSHWKAVLPAGSLLEVPYEELVADQALWTRRIIEFVDLPWDERCLNFQDTHRSVATASSWQVRQKIYRGSVERWRNYAKFIGPLAELKQLDR
jgi:tetratricopeptide (TPR) repeat protein